ncbi:MAG: iron-containing alcohol dehydrogenase [Candidatus Omnitrophica bacterium]|nr:iron-containing alcohol dehydrogenase [Candidatus Omnitrophota bacterium]MDE2232133.1 iron-containing alcohol dehydrogenase [Candidatus Omnitrophota bacterium]
MISKRLNITSRVRDYEVSFVADLRKALGSERLSGAFLIIDADLPGAAAIKKLFTPNRVISIKASEKSKTLEGCTVLIKNLTDRQFRRNDCIVAIGGGVIEDMVGFAATILMRGVEWVFCPTTLLAQADSCIGGKSSINMGPYKNLLGSFYPPRKILIDLAFLKTLPEDQIRSGIGEILHFYLVAGQDKLAQQMMSGYAKYLKEPEKLQSFILKSLAIKKAVIERDEFDKGERLLFNYGHTFGHAIESVSGYKINHGQAVTMGMDIANYLSWRMGYIQKGTYVHLQKILRFNIPLFRPSRAQWPRFCEALSKDKKNIGKALGCILTRGPGKMFKAQIPMDGPVALIREYFTERRV